jgi:ubiquinone/menaquinone biosynthesis C-methylase UbiE
MFVSKQQNMRKFLENFKRNNAGIYLSLEGATGASYDNKAKAYEKMVGSKLYNNIMWGTSPNDYIEFSKKAILETSGTGIDIGCGGLVQTAEQYKKTKNEFVLLDNSIEMLKVGLERLKGHDNGAPDNIHLLQGDAFKIPFNDQSFDTVCSFGVLHIFNEQQALINEALRVLKPSGEFFFSALTSDRFLSRKYMSLLRTQGEFGQPLNSKQYIELFDKQTITEIYTKGSMVFICGKKGR